MGQECVVLAQLMASKVRELSDVCHHDADLPGRSQAAAPSSPGTGPRCHSCAAMGLPPHLSLLSVPVLGPYLVQGVLSHLSPSSSLTEADLRWEAVSPGHGSTVEGKGPVGMSIVLKAGKKTVLQAEARQASVGERCEPVVTTCVWAGDVELSLLEVEAVTGVNLTVLAMLDFDFWRCAWLTGHQASTRRVVVVEEGAADVVV